jgi:hypothetical protein
MSTLAPTRAVQDEASERAAVAVGSTKRSRERTMLRYGVSQPTVEETTALSAFPDRSIFSSLPFSRRLFWFHVCSVLEHIGCSGWDWPHRSLLLQFWSARSPHPDQWRDLFRDVHAYLEHRIDRVSSTATVPNGQLAPTLPGPGSLRWIWTALSRAGRGCRYIEAPLHLAVFAFAAATIRSREAIAGAFPQNSRNSRPWAISTAAVRSRNR